MSGEPEAGGNGEFAVLLRELKDRSGLSYGALAKRLHMSASTLHRYCHGTAVPVEYAPVERLARVCRATPQELVELHRRWVLADAARTAGSPVRSGDAPGAAPARSQVPSGDAPGAAPDRSQVRSGEVSGAAPDRSQVPSGDAPGPASQTPAADRTSPAPPHDVDEGAVVVGVRPPASRRRRRRTVLVAAGVVAAALVAGLLAARPWGDGAGPAAARAGKAPAATPPGTPSRTPSASPSTATATPTSPSATATPSRTSGTGTHHAGAAPRTGGATGAVPLAVTTRPYVYDNPCAQHFLVRNEPGQVGPPASEDEAPRWAAVYGAVSSGDQRVALTVQGTGAQTVVLEGLHVKVESKGAPLAWNDYSMGVGCGGDAQSASFDVDLDAGSPVLTAKNGQRGFPYKVSESDPEVISVTAHTKAHDVRWYLTLQWSSGNRHGTLRVDNSGTQFRTSADVDRPGYDYPLGWTDWIPRTN